MSEESSAINPRRSNRWMRLFSFAYVFIVISALLLMYAGGDRWWSATVFLFGPRWLLLLPLLLLIPLAVVLNKWSLIPLSITALIIVGPFMRFNFPLHNANGSNCSETPKLRVLSCNIDSARIGTSHLLSLVTDMSVDIVALQECPTDIVLSLPAGWQLLRERGLAVSFPVK